MNNHQEGFKTDVVALAGVAQLIGASPCTPKGYGFDPQSGHTLRLWVCSQVRACKGSNQLMFLSCTDVSLSLSLSLSLFPSLFLSLQAMKKCPQVKIKRKRKTSWVIPWVGGKWLWMI